MQVLEEKFGAGGEVLGLEEKYWGWRISTGTIVPLPVLDTTIKKKKDN